MQGKIFRIISVNRFRYFVVVIIMSVSILTKTKMLKINKTYYIIMNAENEITTEYQV